MSNPIEPIEPIIVSQVQPQPLPQWGAIDSAQWLAVADSFPTWDHAPSPPLPPCPPSMLIAADFLEEHGWEVEAGVIREWVALLGR